MLRTTGAFVFFIFPWWFILPTSIHILGNCIFEPAHILISMQLPPSTYLLFLYGVFLILCGIASVIFIGKKAKTAIISGGMSGLLSIGIAYAISQGISPAIGAGVTVSLGLFAVFSWRATLTLFKVFELIPHQDPTLRGKGIAFLIIALMAVVSLVVSLLQLLFLFI